MKITILTTFVLIFAGLLAYVISFINGAKYVDYALGIMMGIICIMLIIITYMVETSKEFTDKFRKDISSIKVEKKKADEVKQNTERLNKAKEYTINALGSGKETLEVETALLNNGLSEEEISQIVTELIEEGRLQVGKQKEEPQKKTKKKVKKKK